MLVVLVYIVKAVQMLYVFFLCRRIRRMRRRCAETAPLSAVPAEPLLRRELSKRRDFQYVTVCAKVMRVFNCSISRFKTRLKFNFIHRNENHDPQIFGNKTDVRMPAENDILELTNSQRHFRRPLDSERILVWYLVEMLKEEVPFSARKVC